MMHADSHATVFFDGTCGLCNRWVDFLLKVDRRGVLRFAPLQGSTAREVLGEDQARKLDTVYFRSADGRLDSRSTAVLRAMAASRNIFKLLLCFLFVPRFIRDRVYDVVAANRYAWFGKRETCRLPTPEERARFLP
jgi:predicted DCC family thiol-disulfide oxidoreductase YuxK